MNKRLEKIAALIEDGRGFIDVGTDHGYLPVELALREYKGKIFASDINSDPLSKARRNAAEAGLEERIEFILADGLDGCPAEDIDTIIIAGMGGDTICGILDRAEWCMDGRYKLLLQPMTKAEVLRYWLVNNGFEIKSEELVYENGTVYQIIETVFGGETLLNDAELFSGKKELCTDSVLFEKQRLLLIKRFRKAVSGLDGSSEPELLSGRRILLEGIIKQLERMK